MPTLSQKRKESYGNVIVTSQMDSGQGDGQGSLACEQPSRPGDDPRFKCEGQSGPAPLLPAVLPGTRDLAWPLVSFLQVAGHPFAGGAGFLPPAWRRQWWLWQHSF